MARNALIVLITVAVHLSVTWAAPQVPIQGGPKAEAEEIAPYTVVQKGKTYEVRNYAPMKWVCVDHVGESLRSRDQARMFFDLFDYISGQNSAGVEVKMTAPVSVLTKPNSDSQGNTLSQMCFYIPKIHQDNPPKPSGEDVYIENRPEMTVATRQFGGFMKKQADWIAQMEILKADLIAEKVQEYDFNSFYGAGYDSPFKFTNRRNEIWLVKKQ